MPDASQITIANVNHASSSGNDSRDSKIYNENKSGKNTSVSRPGAASILYSIEVPGEDTHGFLDGWDGGELEQVPQPGFSSKRYLLWAVWMLT